MGSEESMYVEYLTWCKKKEYSHVSRSKFTKMRKHEYVGLLKYNKFLSDSVTQLAGLTRQLKELNSHGNLKY